MNKQIERILICLLWLLAATLGVSFWLNTMFGFNLFSAQHWQYLAYMQASQTPIRGGFYVSLICATLITVSGLYILIRPHAVLRRHANIYRARQAQSTQRDNPTPTAPAPLTQAQNTTPVQSIPATPMRPRGPITMLRTTTEPMRTPTQNTQITPAAPVASVDFDAIKQIFSDAGYTVKPSPQMGNFRPAVLAIGLDEVLWIGGVGISQQTLSTAMDRMASIFTDTLDDIEIRINGFIIAPDAPVTDNTILSFTNVNELREYMDAHKNPAISDNDARENFNAYSEYIDTVINYMDKT